MNFIVTDIKKAGASDDNQPIGTPSAGYAGAEDGPFMCGHCIHFKEVGEGGKEGRCNHPKVIKDSQMKKDKDGKAIVEEGSCCTYFRNDQY